MHAILGQWAPPMERSFLGSMVVAGQSLNPVTFNRLMTIIGQYDNWQTVIWWYLNHYCIHQSGVTVPVEMICHTQSMTVKQLLRQFG